MPGKKEHRQQQGQQQQAQKLRGNHPDQAKQHKSDMQYNTKQAKDPVDDKTATQINQPQG